MSTAGQNSHGPFFWVALVSFLVPLAVAAKAFQEVRVTTRPTPHPDASGVDHAIWDYLLKSHVENGLVDYDGISRDYLFRTYLLQLSEADPQELATPSDKLALLCNAYNAFVINGVITHNIHGSVMDFHLNELGFFDVPEHIFGGRTMSLNQIEHELVRKRFQEPRIHVALVCAARSCPSIRPEAYVGGRLDVQLEDQSIQFVNDRRYVDYDETTNSLMLSPLLNWYGDDWRPVGGYLDWLATRTADSSLRQAIAGATRGEVRVAFLEYDWSLNSKASNGPASNARQHKAAAFGSGSIPNE